MNNKTFEHLPDLKGALNRWVRSELPFSNLPIIGDYFGKPEGKKGVLPEVRYVVEKFTADAEHLSFYNQVCGFKDNGFLPPTYLGVIAQRLQMDMLTQEPYPYPTLGTVHIANKIVQHRPVAQYETLKLSCEYGKLEPHEKGHQFDFLTKAFDEQGELVYEAFNTYLIRGKSSLSGDAKPSVKQSKPAPKPDDIHGVWHVPADQGRVYAKAGGDYNFIHLHPLLAKAFGFKAAIVHGMWSKARVLAELGEFPDAFEVSVNFKLPIFLPAQVELIAHAEQVDGKKVIEFTLYDAKSDKPHLTGVLKEL